MSKHTKIRLSYEDVRHEVTPCDNCGAPLLAGDIAWLADGDDYGPICCSEYCADQLSICDYCDARTGKPLQVQSRGVVPGTLACCDECRDEIIESVRGQLEDFQDYMEAE